MEINSRDRFFFIFNRLLGFFFYEDLNFVTRSQKFYMQIFSILIYQNNLPAISISLRFLKILFTL